LPFAITNAVIWPSTPHTIASPVAATTIRKSFGPSGAATSASTRSVAVILPVTLTVDGASATILPSIERLRLANS
jgi:hypothetical protein